MRSKTAVAVVGLMIIGRSLTADHFPEHLIASGPADHALASVPVAAEAGAADLSVVVRAFGPPMDYHDPHSDVAPVRGGEASYLWRRGRGVEINVNTMWHFDDQGRRVETVVACSISGSRSEIPFCSARGVCLGDSRKAVEEKYGRKYLQDQLPDHDAVRYQFRDGTVLEFDMTKEGVVTRIALVASAE
jgi:hypothetical protein